MAKRKRVVRGFFNTFYDDVAKRIIEEVKRLYSNVRVVRSSVLPEFYYLEVSVEEGSLDEVRERLEKVIRELGGDRVFGVKLYTVET